MTTATTAASSHVHWDSAAAPQNGSILSPFQGQHTIAEHQPAFADGHQNHGRLFPDTAEGHMATVCVNLEVVNMQACSCIIWLRCSVLSH